MASLLKNRFSICGRLPVSGRDSLCRKSVWGN
nr:MAG TPA_asm: hypothetical protein [Caudoviricetes sp.]